jgi:hypothetical protein
VLEVAFGGGEPLLFEGFAQSRGLKWSAGAEPIDRLVEAIARIAGDLEAQRRMDARGAD